MAPKTDVIEQLRARIAELEAKNARLKTESRDACLGLNDYYGRKLAAEQLNNKRMRDALEYVDDTGLLIGQYVIHEKANSVVRKAISLPASTEALDAYVAEKAEEAYLNAQRAHTQFEAGLTKQRDLAVEAMREALECGEDGDWQSARRILTSVIKESKNKGV